MGSALNETAFGLISNAGLELQGAFRNALPI